ncbi:hypothetical protein PsorP6_016039 [Peronosclerospora sorghi]|uniref:Uncharacterized protein n=1 Tax=Peronosclerospora sorghi TaxID=230839 RepID=A0ACC0WMB4_9STRA|nr:hypothetical protein PsorP6_016039 [Peronosclerospora sorghi]
MRAGLWRVYWRKNVFGLKIQCRIEMSLTNEKLIVTQISVLGVNKKLRTVPGEGDDVHTEPRCWSHPSRRCPLPSIISHTSRMEASTSSDKISEKSSDLTFVRIPILRTLSRLQIICDDLSHLGEIPSKPLAHEHRVRVDFLIQLVHGPIACMIIVRLYQG